MIHGETSGLGRHGRLRRRRVLLRILFRIQQLQQLEQLQEHRKFQLQLRLQFQRKLRGRPLRWGRCGKGLLTLGEDT
jgi:hypothetical protein